MSIRNILGARPVLDAAYAARLKSLGADPRTPELNPQPARGSIMVTCETCGGGAWLGPEQQAAWAGQDDLEIMCLLCCWLFAKTAQNAGVPVTIIGLDSNQ